jgi:hypothetical protein
MALLTALYSVADMDVPDALYKADKLIGPYTHLPVPDAAKSSKQWFTKWAFNKDVKVDKTTPASD